MIIVIEQVPWPLWVAYAATVLVAGHLAARLLIR